MPSVTNTRGPTGLKLKHQGIKSSPAYITIEFITNNTLFGAAVYCPYSYLE